MSALTHCKRVQHGLPSCIDAIVGQLPSTLGLCDTCRAERTRKMLRARERGYRVVGDPVPEEFQPMIAELAYSIFRECNLELDRAVLRMMERGYSIKDLRVNRYPDNMTRLVANGVEVFEISWRSDGTAIAYQIRWLVL